MRPVAFGEPLPGETRLTLFRNDKPDRFFTVIKFWMDETSGMALELKTGVPSHQVEDEEGRTHLLLHLQIGEENEDRWCLWRPDQLALIRCLPASMPSCSDPAAAYPVEHSFRRRVALLPLRTWDNEFLLELSAHRKRFVQAQYARLRRSRLADWPQTTGKGTSPLW